MPLLCVLLVFLLSAVTVVALQAPLLSAMPFITFNTGLLCYGLYRSARYGSEPLWEPISSVLLLTLTMIYYSYYRLSQVQERTREFIW